MAWARKRRKRVPDYGRPRRREIGFAQYISHRKRTKKSHTDNVA